MNVKLGRPPNKPTDETSLRPIVLALLSNGTWYANAARNGATLRDIVDLAICAAESVNTRLEEII